MNVKRLLLALVPCLLAFLTLGLAENANAQTENFDHVAAPSLPPGLICSAPPGMTAETTTAFARTSPNSLVLGGVNPGAAAYALFPMRDNVDGAIALSVDILVHTSAPGCHENLIADASTPDVSGNFVGVDFQPSSGEVSLSYFTAGQPAVFADKTLTGLKVDRWYRFTLSISGKTARLQIYGYTEEQYLNAANAFQPSAVPALSGTSPITGAGYFGIAAYHPAATEDVCFDHLTQSVLAPATAYAHALSIASATVGSPLIGTLTQNGTGNSAVKLSDGGADGAFRNNPVTLSGMTPGTYAYTPARPGLITLTATSSAGLPNPAPITIAVRAAPRPPRTYYISPAGRDSAAGTSARMAWKTLGKVMKTGLVAGDIVLFQGGGTWRGSLLILDSGTSAAPITLGSYGPGQATFRPGDGDGIKLYNCQNVTVHNFTIIGSGVTHSGATTSAGIGINIYSDVTSGSKWQNVTIDHCDISGLHDAIVLHTPIGGQPVVGYNNVKVTHCSLHDCLLGGFWCEGGSKTSGNPWHFALGQSTFTQVTVAHNQIYNIFGDPTAPVLLGLPISILNVTHCLCEYNILHDNGATSSSRGAPGGVGALVFLECADCIAQFNEAYKTATNIAYDGCAFDIDGGCTNCVLQCNYSHDNDGAGYQTGDFAGDSPPTTGAIIRDNLSQNDGRKNSAPALQTFGGSGASFDNNTVFISKPISGSPPCFGMGGGSASAYNNVFLTTGGMPLVKATGGTATLAGNDYWALSGPFLIDWNGKRYASLAAWQSATGQDSHGLSVNPLLKQPGNGVTAYPAPTTTITAYDPLPGSPLLGAGLDLAALYSLPPGTMDYHGMPIRPGAPYAIGAVR